MSNSKVIAASLLIPIFLAINLPAGRHGLPTVSADSFTDVKPGNPYFVAISYLKEKNIIEGYEDNSFKPKASITRAEALKMLTLASGVFTDSMEKPQEAPFTDTPVEEWYTGYLSAAKDKKIINGYNDGSFKPNDPINLAESLKMYFEAVNSVNNGQINFEESINENFIDVAPDSWFKKYTNYAGFHQLINIYNDNTVNPNQVMSRGYLAEIIYRTMQNKEGVEFGKATYYFGIPGKDNDSYDQELMTTAHKTLPKGTILKVTNMTNGKSVKVKVTDRGPYGPGRVLDLSKKAFSKIALPSEGIVNIEFQQVSPEI